MNAAITTLEIALDTLLNNEPINRAEGKPDQADLEARSAVDIRWALRVLREIQAGPNAVTVRLGQLTGPGPA